MNPTQIRHIASVCHEANRAYCLTLGDTSQLPWSDAPEWQQKSAIDGVANIINGKVTHPKDSHESWLAQKAADGWKYGSVKDADKKEHPCFVPYKELPDDQKRKDYIFFNIVKAFLADV